jgi:hypothetical protein
MTRDDITRMAREAGLHLPYWDEGQDPKKDPPRWTMVSPLPPLLERFASLVVERDEALMRQALEALESLFSWQADPDRGQRCSNAVVALRTRLGNQPPAAVEDRLARHGIPMPVPSPCPDCHGVGYDASGQLCGCQENPSF